MSGLRPAATDEVPCNLCGAREYDVVGTRDRDGEPLRTVLCRHCGLVWTNPRPPVAEMDRYYATEYRADYKGDFVPPRRKILRGLLGAQDRLRALRALVGPRVLDVGCGAGEFVYLLRWQGIDAAGLEPGEAYAEFARRVLGVPVQTATVDTAVVEPGSCDLVTMFHALEHVPDPRRVLATVCGWLKPQGRLVVEVPNVASTVQSPAHRFHYAHLYHFTAATLGALGEAVGLTAAHTSYSDDGGNVTCVFRRDTGVGRPPSGLEASAARTRQILRTHTRFRHYVSPVPYVRAAGRLRRRWREDRLLRRLGTMDDVLQWASEPGRPT